MSQQEIDKSSLPLVSICVVTYNHEKFIREALDSFLMQQTSFPVEIVIHDDASTDNTQQIIEEYHKQYPHILKPLLQTENQRSISGGGMNPRFNYPRSRGKYIALCEGDDYWTDPLKLQKQFEFLEDNPDFVGCGHYTSTQYDFVPNSGEQHYVHAVNRANTLTKRDFMRVGSFHTSSFFFRRETTLKAPTKSVIFRDNPLKIFLLSYGHIKILPEVMSVYRRNKGGVSENINVEKIYQAELKSIERLMGALDGFYWKGSYMKSHWRRYYLSNGKDLTFSKRLGLFFKFILPSFYVFPRNLKHIASALIRVFVKNN